MYRSVHIVHICVMSKYFLYWYKYPFPVNSRWLWGRKRTSTSAEEVAWSLSEGKPGQSDVYRIKWKTMTYLKGTPSYLLSNIQIEKCPMRGQLSLFGGPQSCTCGFHAKKVSEVSHAIMTCWCWILLYYNYS